MWLRHVLPKYQSTLLAPIRLFHNASNERDQIFPPPCRFGVLNIFGSHRPFWLICPGKKQAQKPVLCVGGDRFIQNILHHSLK